MGVSKESLRGLSGISRMLKGCLKGFSRMFQVTFNCVFRMSQVFFKTVSRVFYGRHKGSSRMPGLCQGCLRVFLPEMVFKFFSRILKCCSKVVSRVSQECLKTV